MLWKVGAIVMAGWLVAWLLLNKGGMIHTLLLVALASFVIQFVQDHRTKAYERSLKP
jgi:predicted PurR-regulated permease PerM